MLRLASLYCLLSAVALPAFACGPAVPGLEEGASVSVGRMADRVWAVTRLAGQAVAAEAGLWLMVGPGGTVTGQAGCNRYSGLAELDAGVMVFGPLAVTEMACAPEVMALEASFLTLLSQVRGFAVGPEGGLWLSRADGSVVACLE